MLQHLVDLLVGSSLWTAYGFVLTALVLCGFGLPMPEDIFLVTGGVLAWLASPLEQATFPGMLADKGLVMMMVVGLVGILAGDSAIYMMGRRYGYHVAELRLFRKILAPEKLRKVEALMRRRGNVVVVVARYLPGLRAPTYFTAGHARLPYWEFLLFDSGAALISAPVWVGLGFYFGSDIGRAAHEAARFSHYIVALGLMVVALLALRWFQRRRSSSERGPRLAENSDARTSR